MEINLNVSVKGGKGIPVSVKVYAAFVKEKELEFSNGARVSEAVIVRWIENELGKLLRGIQEQK